MSEQSIEAPPPAAEQIFGENLSAAVRYAHHLATTGVEWGLIGPRELPRLWSRHILNCAVVECLLEPGQKVADVGSGSGLPGLALALAQPACHYALIEPMERRVTWLGEVVSDLGLDNVEVVRAHAEELVGGERYEVVTARAVAAMTSLAGMTLPLVAPGGEVLAIKGRSAPDEVRKAAKQIRKMGGERVEVLEVGEDVLETPTTVVRIQVGRDGRGSRTLSSPGHREKKRG